MTEPADSAGRTFATAQRWLPQHRLSALMHRCARARNPLVRNLLIGTVLRTYPLIDMTEALEPDPFAYESFNAFFTRALRPGVRPIEAGERCLVSPVDGTVSQIGVIDSDRLLQAKGRSYTLGALLADPQAPALYGSGRFACLYLAPYNYHRIHMPCDGRLIAARYVPGALFSVNSATALQVPDLFARNERVVCEFDTPLGRVALVMVGALMVGSIETVFTGEINPPAARRGEARDLAVPSGLDLAKGAELGRFNMGSTVILVLQDRSIEWSAGLTAGSTVRLGRALGERGP
jgi:phosphatidylserine decarboxylase